MYRKSIVSTAGRTTRGFGLHWALGTCRGPPRIREDDCANTRLAPRCGNYAAVFQRVPSCRLAPVEKRRGLHSFLRSFSNHNLPHCAALVDPSSCSARCLVYGESWTRKETHTARKGPFEAHASCFQGREESENASQRRG